MVCLSHRDIKIPRRGLYYSVNQGCYPEIRPGDASLCRSVFLALNLGLRYIGTMVSDIHRTLFWGIFPNSPACPQWKIAAVVKAPVAFIVRQAGRPGDHTQMNRILEIEPAELHQRATFVAGSPVMVSEMVDFVRKYSAVSSV